MDDFLSDADAASGGGPGGYQPPSIGGTNADPQTPPRTGGIVDDNDTGTGDPDNAAPAATSPGWLNRGSSGSSAQQPDPSASPGAIRRLSLVHRFVTQRDRASNRRSEAYYLSEDFYRDATHRHRTRSGSDAFGHDATAAVMHPRLRHDAGVGGMLPPGGAWRAAGRSRSVSSGHRDPRHGVCAAVSRACGASWARLQTFLFLALLGILASSVAWGMDAAATRLSAARDALLLQVTKCVEPWRSDPAGNGGFACPHFPSTKGAHGYHNKSLIPSEGEYAKGGLGGAVGFAALAPLFACAASALVWFCVPAAVGSGIPRMKAVLSGIHLRGFLRGATLVAKCAGLVLVLGSGVPVGKEGPFVHVACCLAMLLMRVPCFARYGRSSSRRLDMLAVGCAVGVAATFGAPFGGVLFAIEVVSTYFQVSNLPRMFWAATCGTFFLHAARSSAGGASVDLFTTDFEAKAPNASSVALFVLLGLLSGLAGGLFNRAVARACRLSSRLWPTRRRHGTAFARLFLRKVLPCVCGVALAQAALVAAVSPKLAAALRQHYLVGFCFNAPTPLGAGQAWVLAVILGVTAIVVPFSLALPIPAGLFTPVFLLGALGGRLYGEAAHAAGSPTFTAGEFAVAGAAALAGASTRAISTAVIVMELTGQLHMQMPVAVSVLTAYFVANRIAPPVYDCLIVANAVPFLPRLSRLSTFKHVDEVMRPAAPGRCLSVDLNRREHGGDGYGVDDAGGPCQSS